VKKQLIQRELVEFHNQDRRIGRRTDGRLQLSRILGMHGDRVAVHVHTASRFNIRALLRCSFLLKMETIEEKHVSDKHALQRLSEFLTNQQEKLEQIADGDQQTGSALLLLQTLERALEAQQQQKRHNKS